MADASDVAAFAMLDRWILRVLRGDEKTDGLYRTVRNAKTWDEFQRTCGKIEAYELVRDEMLHVARVMSGEPEPEQNVRRVN